MKNIVLALLVVIGFASESFGAAMNFRGSITTYTGFLGAADPLGIGPVAPATPRDFVAWINTSGTSIVNGAISFQSAPNVNYLLTGGTLTTGAGTTTFSGMNFNGLAGVTLNFNFAQQIGAGLGQNELNELLFVSGGTTVNYNNGGNVGFYAGSVQAVPEPSSMIVLSAIGGAAGLWIRRRRRSEANAA